MAMTAPGLGRDITIALVVKLVLLTLIYALFFGPETRPAVGPERVAQQILAPNPDSETPR